MTDAPELLPDEVNVCVNWEETRKYFSKDTVAALLAAERKKALEEGYKAGFMASGQGWNGEYPMQDKGADPEADDYWLDCRDEAIRALMEKEQGK